MALCILLSNQHPIDLFFIFIITFFYSNGMCIYSRFKNQHFYNSIIIMLPKFTSSIQKIK